MKKKNMIPMHVVELKKNNNVKIRLKFRLPKFRFDLDLIYYLDYDTYPPSVVRLNIICVYHVRVFNDKIVCAS